MHSLVVSAGCISELHALQWRRLRRIVARCSHTRFPGVNAATAVCLSESRCHEVRLGDSTPCISHGA